MHREPFIMACTGDFAGQVRGKGFPARELAERWETGIGWTPTNIMINCFGQIQATPWGASGDLTLRPDPAGDVTIDFGDGIAPERFILSFVDELNGDPWVCCPRHYLRMALAELAEEFGLFLRVAFEHEFTCLGLEPRLGGSYGLESIRTIGELPEIILAALDRAQLEPETFLPEYSPGQFEVTVRPAVGLEAADRAVKLRQIIRAAALRKGLRASFTPIMRRGGVGNGVHVHFSLEDKDGKPLSYDPAGLGGVSATAGQFIAGILAHGRALCAVTAPSVISYERLRPNAWSASVTNLGKQDREALVRICPVSEKPGAKVERSFNFEFRAADAAATPHLTLGAIVRAGLHGLRNRLSMPKAATVIEIANMSEAERSANGIVTLPHSLGEALDHLDRSEARLMPLGMKMPYLMHKRGELAQVADTEIDALCSMYAQVY
ncbi:MAG: glutamine synthetase family protein [Dongiaceae bacterium]